MLSNYFAFTFVSIFSISFTFSQSDGTPVGGKSVDMYYYKNSLYNHAQPGTDADANTNVGNWIARMAQQAPIPNSATLGSTFGFITNWTVPPTDGGFFTEITTPYINGSWAGAENIDLVGFVPDNFDGQAFDPADTTNLGASYEERISFFINEWETNAPNSNRRYVIYTGWPTLGGYGGTADDPSTVTTSQYSNWRNYGLTVYQNWMQLLVYRLQMNYPSLEIRIHDISRALLMMHENEIVGDIAPSVLFEDLAPHGRSSWYFLAAIAEYIELYDEKPPVNFVFQSSWNVAPEITENYQLIVNYFWNILKGTTSTSNTDILPNSGFKILENPARNMITINTDYSDFTTMLISTSGEIVQTSENSKKIEISHLPKGLYFLKLSNSVYCGEQKVIIE